MILFSSLEGEARNDDDDINRPLRECGNDTRHLIAAITRHARHVDAVWRVTAVVSYMLR